MFRKQSRSSTTTALRLAVAAVLLHGGVAVAGDLRVCVDETNPAAEIDARVAAAVAKAEGATLKVDHYRGVPKGDDDDFDAHNYKSLLGERCDLVMGYPYAPASGDLPKFLKATRPYATTGFVLLTLHGTAAGSLSALPDGAHVAVVYNTLPNYYFRDHPALVRDIVEADGDALDAVSSKTAAGAMLWRASVVNVLESRHALGRFDLHPLDQPTANYNLVALYRSDNLEAGTKFETAIESLRAAGALKNLLGSYADAADHAPPQASLATARRHRGIGVSAHASRTARSCASKPAKAPPALYSDAQAQAGEVLFDQKCALCHGPLLEGRAGPALTGKFFLSADAKHTLGDIFTIVSQNMPATLPGSLQPDEYVKIMSFILEKNGYPAGSTELTFDGAKKSKQQLRYLGP